VNVASLERQHASVLVEHLPLVTYSLLLEPPFQAVYVSPQLQPIFGYSADDCVAGDGFWFQKIHPDDRGRLREALAALHATHDPMSVEYRVETSDGRLLWVRDVAVVARDESGTLVGHGYLTDVTREKELERQLETERVQADAFFRGSSVGLAISDEDGRYVRVNEALAGITGASVGEHIGKTLFEIAPAVAAAVEGVYRDVEATGDPVHQRELTIPTLDGERIVLLSVFALELDGRRHYGRIVVDITEQRRAERDRADAEQQYRRLIEQLPLVSYVNALAPEHRAIFVSPQILELFGYSPAEFLADATLGDRCVHPDDLARVEREETAAREAGEGIQLEYRIVRRDGSTRWVLDLMETVRDIDGTPLFEQGFLVDITEWRESERLFRAIFGNAFEAIVIVDDEGRCVDANLAAQELFGRGSDDLLGRNLVQLVHRVPSIAEFLAAGEAAGDCVVVRPDGEEREVEFAAKANVLEGRHLSVLRDVTQRRELERELWRAQKLESVGRLAGGVAQDFNNMLTAIRGHAQLLAGHSGPDSAEFEHARQIDQAAERAAALTAQLLAFGRRQMLEARPVDLNRLVDRLEGMLHRVVDGGAELAFELEPGICAVRVDPSQIEQVVLNLVANAADATPAGGRIVVSTRVAHVDEEDELDLAPGRYAVVAVEDTGCGIDEDGLEYLFEPFFTTKNVGAGTGLGLATAYGIVKQSGGSIEVATEVGRGSTFTVYLPETTAADAGTVLALEPDHRVADVVFELLTDAGYRVLSAGSAADVVALSRAYDGGIDLFVGDLGSAGTPELVRTLQASRPAIATVSLQKPYTPDRLRSEVRQALGAV
jgi:two-component system, cell cycle sensor histidine kinase and response regulator CckA